MNTGLCQNQTTTPNQQCNTSSFSIVSFSKEKAPPTRADLKDEIRKYLQALITEARMWDIYCVSVSEAAVLLSVEVDTVRDWIKCGKLTASKLGREWTIRVADIDKLLKSNSNIVPMDDRRFKTNRRKIS